MRQRHRFELGLAVSVSDQAKPTTKLNGAIHSVDGFTAIDLSASID
jgi:hypothetical protein